MTDRELLELAAKAAGIEVCGPVERWMAQPDKVHEGGFLVRNDRGGDSCWNPLKDDGDALRLSVKLDMMLFFSSTHTEAVAQVYDHENDCMVADASQRIRDNEGCSALRRAIVRAAAEIGKQMP